MGGFLADVLTDIGFLFHCFGLGLKGSSDLLSVLN